MRAYLLGERRQRAPAKVNLIQRAVYLISKRRLYIGHEFFLPSGTLFLSVCHNRCRLQRRRQKVYMQTLLLVSLTFKTMLTLLKLLGSDWSNPFFWGSISDNSCSAGYIGCRGCYSSCLLGRIICSSIYLFHTKQVLR